MSAKIIEFRPKGNGAREAVAVIFNDPCMRMPLGKSDATADADYFLIKLYMAGFEIVPALPPEVS